MSNEDDDIAFDESFDEFEKKEGKSLGDLWRDNPMIKIGVVAAALIGVVGIVMMFGGQQAPVAPSNVSQAPEMTATPGTTEASKAYVEAVQEQNEKDLESAYQQGGSALPVPIDPPVGVISAAPEEQEAEDPLQRWRRLQEERLQRELAQRETVSPQIAASGTADQDRNEAIQQLAGIMSQQMSSILGKKGIPTRVQTKMLTSPTYLEEKKRKEEEEQQAEEEALQADSVVDESAGTLLMSAGEIVYAQMLTEANTDSPGPVLAEIVSGPLKGSRILGTFEEKEELPTLNFDTVVVDGESIAMTAVALDPKTTLPGMATEVDHRYFKRVVLPAAAAFVEGMSSAIAESGKTTVTVSGTSGTTTTEDTGESSDDQEVATGVQEAGAELREILDEMVDETKIMVKIHAGTPFGLLFMEPVIKPNPNAVAAEEEQEEDITNEQIPLEELLGDNLQVIYKKN